MTQTATETLSESTVNNNLPDNSLVDWIFANRRTAVGILVAIVIAAGAVSAVKASRQAKAAQASEALFAAQSKTPGTPEAQSALEAVATAHAGTQQAWQALMILAEQAGKNSKSEEAAKYYSQADSQAVSDAGRLFARYGRAFALEKAGKPAEALAAIESAQKLAHPMLKSELALARARLFDIQGKKTEAQQAYEGVIKDFANTEAARTAEQWKAISK